MKYQVLLKDGIPGFDAWIDMEEIEAISEADALMQGTALHPQNIIKVVIVDTGLSV